MMTYPSPHRLSSLLQRLASFRALLVASMLLGAVVWSFRYLGLLEVASLRTLDWGTRLYASPATAPDVAVVAVSDADLDRFANPRSKELLAKILTALDPYDVRGIVFTEVLKPGEPGLDEFAKLVLARPDVYLLSLTPPSRQPQQQPPILRQVEQFGRHRLSGVEIDVDGFVRRGVVSVFDGEQAFPSLIVKVAELALGSHGAAEMQWISLSGELMLGGKSAIEVEVGHSEYRSKNPTVDRRRSVLIAPKYWGGVDTYDFSTLLDQRIALEQLKNRVIVVGMSTPRLTSALMMVPRSDGLRYKEYGPAERVALLGQNLISAARGDTEILRAPPEWFSALWIVFWILLTLLISKHGTNWRSWLISVVSIVLLLTASSWLALAWGWWLPFVPALLGITLATADFFRRVFQRARSLRRFVAIAQAIMDRLPEPVFVTDEYGRLRLVNVAMCRLFGCAPQQLLGSRLQDVWPQASGLDLASLPAQRLQGEDVLGQAFETELRLARVPMHFAPQALSLGLVSQSNKRLLRVDLQTFRARCRYAQERARALGLSNMVLEIELTDWDDIGANLGANLQSQYGAAIEERLLDALHSAEALCSPRRGVYWILLGANLAVANEDTIDADVLATGALAWPVLIESEPIPVLFRSQLLEALPEHPGGEPPST